MALVYLLSFFREMLSCADKNKLTPEKISELLCECLVGEDKLATTNAKNFRREHLVRADTPLGKQQRRLTSPRPSQRKVKQEEQEDVEDDYADAGEEQL